ASAERISMATKSEGSSRRRCPCEQWLDARHTQGPKQGQRRLDDPSDFVAIEIRSALARNIPVIPVLVGRAAGPGEDDLPESLKPLAWRHAAEARPGRDFDDHVSRLIRGIEYLLPQDHKPQQQEFASEFTNSLGMKFVLIP